MAAPERGRFVAPDSAAQRTFQSGHAGQRFSSEFRNQKRPAGDRSAQRPPRASGFEPGCPFQGPRIFSSSHLAHTGDIGQRTASDPHFSPFKTYCSLFDGAGEHAAGFEPIAVQSIEAADFFPCWSCNTFLLFAAEGRSVHHQRALQTSCGCRIALRFLGHQAMTTLDIPAQP